MNDSKDSEQAKKVGLLATIGSVLAAFFGVQSAGNWKRDVEGGRPWLFIAVAVIMTLALVTAIFLLVRFVVLSQSEVVASDGQQRHLAEGLPAEAGAQPAAIGLSPGTLGEAVSGSIPVARRMAPCTHCHLDVDIDTSTGYVPRIAGKPAGYLYAQLIHFRDGRRRHAVMNRIVQNLPESYLLEMAEWFAARKAPYPLPIELASDAQVKRGEQLATVGDAAAGIPSCAACHGSTLVGMEPNVPGLLGLPETYLMAQFTAWRTGRRMAAQPDCMHEITKQLDIVDQQAVSAWLASRPVPADTTPAVGQPLPVSCGSVPLPEENAAPKRAIQ